MDEPAEGTEREETKGPSRGKRCLWLHTAAMTVG
jgi:hypothetical protein